MNKYISKLISTLHSSPHYPVELKKIGKYSFSGKNCLKRIKYRGEEFDSALNCIRKPLDYFVKAIDDRCFEIL